MSQINPNLRNHVKYTENHLQQLEEKFRYLEDSSQRNNLRSKGVEHKEGDDEIWDQRKEKVNSILKSKHKINNVKIERAQIIPRRKEAIAKAHLVP